VTPALRFLIVLALLLAPSSALRAAPAPPEATQGPEPRCDLPAAPRDSPALASKARAEVRSTARDGYESTGALFDIVQGSFPDISGCSPTPHTQPMTQAVSSRVTSAAGAEYSHLTHLSFVPGRIPGELSPAVGDLYLHGDGSEPRYVAIRGVDFRKFLFQDVVLRDCDAPDQPCDRERLPGPETPWVGADPAPESVAGLPFDSDAFGCIRQVHGYFAEFNRITKKVRERNDIGRGDRLMHLTNNCREPGNYELALVSRRDGKLWGDHVSLDLDFYGRLMADIEVELGELGTGFRVVGSERKADGTYVYEERAAKDFPAGCGIENLAPFIGKAQRLLGTVAVDVVSGPIPWTEFSTETVAKSGRGPDETIVYRPGMASDAPFHFTQEHGGPIQRIEGPPRPRAGASVWTPVTMPSFEEASAGPFAISAFEVDGRYLGRLKDRVLATDATRLYTFDYSYVRGFRRAEVRETIERDGRPASDPPMLEFRFPQASCGESCVQLIVGNVALAPGDEASFVVGVGTQPLRDFYENRVLQTSQRYALTYDAAGAITDLAGGMGLGLVYVRRSADTPSEYTVDLVSYERAVPVWRGVFSIPSTQ
jgi:hypothetical protein